MTAILDTTELAHFASMTTFVGLATTLILGCFIIRFAPARRRAIADRRPHQTQPGATASPRPRKNGGPFHKKEQL